MWKEVTGKYLAMKQELNPMSHIEVWRSSFKSILLSCASWKAGLYHVVGAQQRVDWNRSYDVERIRWAWNRQGDKSLW